MAATATPRTSERFCAPDADLTISSCDGVLFKVHRKNLEVHSDIFANAANATRPENGDEIVPLEESSDVLDVLFQYMYRQPQPDLRVVEFPVFMGVAEAAEKYVVYSALPAIMIQIQEHITQHPLQILNFAAKHDHKKLGNEAARLSVGLPMSDAATLLAPDTFKKWLVFYDNWHAGARRALGDLFAGFQKDFHFRGDLVTRAHDPKTWYQSWSPYASTRPSGDILAFLDVEFMPQAVA
ncbi:BTB domain-containing protein [Mycena sanguinolenta]|uniref:BTB domain-containing protein n=1 Tax=Mycena sanguinolenta TaxID=230812 RepID=A0A8H7CUB8_9AGAR|nr:BTB domain-containing protein [Mycena sanguinolenta]